ncbi:ABC transporter ATP-binding protein [Clostridium scatologenes]|uniref:ABC transporter related protein n=1 Tax=Clostridium scatologenes TaxID=1548 RepID=A0A0E3GR48_CLOSL|nr:ABC transporter ATP-binding protein [Clostridium scatologenes]AKA69696.1 ABC transporter related protein [Clostridium scatologenes]
MLRLLKYLKPFIGLIIAAIALLFVQAICDLALPDYMSNIVNVGIQQGGIENSIPQAVRKSKMDKLTLFIFGKDKDTVMSNYVFVDKSSKDYDKYVKEYPVLVNEPIYVLKNVSNTEVDKLNPIIGKALLTVSGIENMKANAKGGVINFNGRKLPANTNLFDLFGRLPEDQRGKIMEEGSKKFTALGDKMIVQAAASSVKTEYRALGMNTDKIQNSYIINIGVRMILISLLSAACIVIVGFFAARTAAGLSRNLRSKIFIKVQSFSNVEMNKFSTASLITRTTNDITQIQMLIVIMIRMIFYAPIIGIGGVIKAMSRSTSMSWIIALAVAALLIIIITVIFVSMPKFKIIQKFIDRLNLVTRENLSGIMVVRAFNTQKFEEDRFDKANKDLTDTSLFVNRVMVILFPFMMLIMNGVTVLIVWVGAHQIANSSMQVGDMMAFMQYAMQILFAFLMMSFMFIMIPRASVAGQRIVEVLETDIVINDPNLPKNFDDKLKGVIEFNNVFFKYPGAEENVLNNINFKASPGKTTAIIGATGSGKTTLVSLIPRFYDVTDGQIFIDGIDVREVTQHALRDKIGYVPQKGNLFSGTIESNLKYAKENATEEDLREASEIAQAIEFISDKSDGFKTEISQGGTNVSGGQKQRLAIARALVKKPEIFIFDDSFSALDFKTDAALRKALKAKTSDITVIIVAQRIATIKNAEQIIVLDEGKIVGMGTHKQLMDTCDTYKEIALSQLSKEELA